MESKIKAIIYERNQIIKINIFGYTSKGIPGIEIIGLGQQGRFIKEKFIQITKELGPRIPPLKYTICVEINETLKVARDNVSYVELPLLIIFWSLAGIIPIRNLEDCFAYGKVSVDREVEVPNWPIDYSVLVPKIAKWITPHKAQDESPLAIIPLQNLIEDIGKFTYL